ncbi:MAG: hypothetical protein ACKVZH_24820 [Blastocatellia bacterium]
MIRYLLGELSPEQTDRFEEQYFTDDETFDRLLLTKADLIDLYLHGQLDERQATNFESFFLKSPDNQHEVTLVRSLMKMGSEAARKEPAPWTEKIEKLFGLWPVRARVAAMAFAALLILISGWLMIANRRMSAELEALRAEQQIAARREQELRQSLAALQSQSLTPTPTPTFPKPTVSPSPRVESLLAMVFPLTLTPGQSRDSGELPELKIPVDALNQTGQTRRIKLKLLLVRNFGYSSYSVALKNSSDRTIQTRARLRITSSQSSDAIVVEFSADKLQSGKYSARLSGAGRKEELADYYFRIVRQ